MPGDVDAGFAKRRRCWVLPLPLLLLRRCLQCLGNEKPYCAAQCRSCPKCKKQAAPARRAEARPTPAKRRKCWVRQAASVLGTSSGNFFLPRLRGKVPEGRKGGMKSPSGENTGPLSEIVCHERYTILCIRFHAKRVTRIFVTLL